MKAQNKIDVSNIKLDPYEQEIEDTFEKMEKYPHDIAEQKINEAREAAANYVREKERKEKQTVDLNLHIHLYNEDLQNLQAIAAQKKLSLNNFITNILHQYSTEHLTQT